ncbi:MAG: hypothetical protein AB8B97_26520 [Granulosicoccus sp.]
MSDKKLTLLLPGYTTQRLPVVDQWQQEAELASGMAGSPAVDNPAHAAFRFFDDQERSPWQAQLAQILKLDTAGGKRLPGARLGLLDQQERSLPPEFSHVGTLVRADPICLKADRDSATLLSPEQLRLTDDESAQLITALNAFVAEDNLIFFSLGPCEWYLSGRCADTLESYPPSFLGNRNASSFLPDGDEAAPWRRLMTEIQMLLHAHPVNQLREQRGLMPVNSVWFWGGAPLPIASEAAADVVLYADERQARSWAGHLGITCWPLSKLTADLDNLPAVSEIVVLDLSIVKAWLTADALLLESELVRVDEQWLQPLSLRVSGGQLEQVDLMTEDGLQGICTPQTLPAKTTFWRLWLHRLGNRFQR